MKKCNECGQDVMKPASEFENWRLNCGSAYYLVPNGAIYKAQGGNICLYTKPLPELHPVPDDFEPPFEIVMRGDEYKSKVWNKGFDEGAKAVEGAIDEGLFRGDEKGQWVANDSGKVVMDRCQYEAAINSFKDDTARLDWLLESCYINQIPKEDLPHPDEPTTREDIDRLRGEGKPRTMSDVLIDSGAIDPPTPFKAIREKVLQVATDAELLRKTPTPSEADTWDKESMEAYELGLAKGKELSSKAVRELVDEMPVIIDTLKNRRATGIANHLYRLTEAVKKHMGGE